ncbi:polysaccharide deacetylase family protein [Streptomyces sp. NPDC001595]|uniref:polysaccharide deacetylase family protein n=1 Tax=Streptomyces sp. NPDC001532 TaxID=3154520 RepID=UPI0033247055
MTAPEAAPPRTDRPGSPRRWLVRGLLLALAAAVAATPFAAAWQYETERRAVSAQAPAPGSRADARPPATAARHASAPVVLAYHDIHPEAAGSYTLTPEQLDEQLAALAAAGYRSLSAEEFTRYLATGRPPAPRSVYLTFDDGTRGLWAYADRILAKHHMRASAYLITGRVGTHRPYYLSWAEIDRMSGSGRWDFQAHSHLGHSRAPVEAGGRQGAVLANRLWLPERERLETEAEYRARVTDDLDRNVRSFAVHGLPAPVLFAYPFSEASAPTNLTGRTTSILEGLLRERFAATLTNTSSRPLPAGPRAASAGLVQRLEVMRGTTTAALLEQVRAWTSRSPAEVPEPLRHPGQWRLRDAPPGTGLTALTGRGPARGTYVSAVHLPMATADWTTYRVEATAGRLSGPRTGVSVEVGHGSLHPCVVTVSAAGLRVTERPAGRTPRVTVRALDPAAGHRILIEVSPRSVLITVDGTTLTVRAAQRPEPARTSGGIALAVRNESGDVETAWPRFTSLRLGA